MEAGTSSAVLAGSFPDKSDEGIRASRALGGSQARVACDAGWASLGWKAACGCSSSVWGQLLSWTMVWLCEKALSEVLGKSGPSNIVVLPWGSCYIFPGLSSHTGHHGGDTHLAKVRHKRDQSTWKIERHQKR